MSEQQGSADFKISQGLTPATLDHVQQVALGLMDQVGVPDGQRHAVKVVIEELCTNILEHSHATWMELGLRRQGQGLMVAIADDGLPFDPSPLMGEAPSSARLKRSQERHLGLYMISSLTRGVHYFRDEIGVNVIELEINPEAA